MTLARLYGPDGWQTSPGVPVVRGPFAFAYDEPGLNDGVPFYTPTVGEIIMDAWCVVDEAWDGDTPYGDIGMFVGTDAGMMAVTNYFWQMNSADVDTFGGHGYLAGNSYGSVVEAGAYSGGYRAAPGIVLEANPLKVVVSQTARAGAAAPGATQGRARMFIVTVLPLEFD